jgi:hypothetical protein
MPLIDSINMISSNKPTQDTTAPADLVVSRAEFGNLQQARTNAARVDPLLIELQHVEPGATIEILVVNDPKKSWENSKGDIQQVKVPLTDLGATQQLSLSDKKAAELGIHPGDAIEIRQVDAAGNASKPARVYLNGDGATLSNFKIAPGQASLGDVFLATPSYSYVYDARHGSRTTSDEYNFIRHRDTTKPVVHPQDFNLVLQDPATGQAELSGKMAVERRATVVVKNLASRESFTVKSDDDGTFSLPVKAASGDPLQILVYDRAMVPEDMGTIVFNPKLDKGAQQGGAQGQGAQA